MEREILCRGKRVDNGEWVEGYYVKITSTTEVFHQSYKAIVHSIFPSEENSVKVEVIPETVGEFTGLTDKNGRKIFEGDIVRLTFSGAVGKIICDINYSIHLNLFCRVVDKLLTDYHCEDIEVIGNVFDNSELLKGE